MVVEVGTGLVSAAIGSGLTWTGRKILRAIHLRPKRGFWRFKHEEMVVVCPSREGSFASGPSRRLVTHEDAFATCRLVGELRALGKRCRVIDDQEPIPGGADLTLVCSPRGNLHSAEVYSRVRVPFILEGATPGSPHPMFVNPDVGEFPSPMDRSSESIDVALVARFYETSTDRMVYLFWGLHGPGTIGAVRAVQCSHTLRELERIAKDKDFAVLISVPFDQGDSHRVRIIAPVRFFDHAHRGGLRLGLFEHSSEGEGEDSALAKPQGRGDD